MRKAIKLLRDKSGSSMILGGFVAFCLFVFMLIILESWHLYIVEIGIYDAVQNAVTTACTENYDRLYNGIREGYSGGYKLVGSNWTEDIDTGDIYTDLDSLLKTHAEGSDHVKYDGTKLSYSISDLSVQMTNTPFAPNDPSKANKFTGIAYITLRVPLGFGWGSIPPMTVRMKVMSGYTAKF